jgi:uncharacterized protein YjbI with pentapeptide repeats
MLRGGAAGQRSPALCGPAPGYGSRVADGRPVRWDDAALASACADAERGVIDAPGVSLTADQMNALLQAVRTGPFPAGRLEYVDLSGATVNGTADFSGIGFEGRAGFEGARFAEDVVFAAAEFEQSADFEGARFDGHADFERVEAAELTFTRASFETLSLSHAAVRKLLAEEARVTHSVHLGESSFELLDLSRAVIGEVSAERASFGEAFFEDARILGDAYFFGAVFEGLAQFGDAEIAGSLECRQVRFGGEVELDVVDLNGVANFVEAQFERARRLGPLRARSLRLDRATFERPVRIEAMAPLVSCTETLFRGGVDLLTDTADVLAAGADFGGPSLIAPLRSSLLHAPGAPRLLSLRSAKVAQLSISGADLRVCRFANAHGLDRMVIERAELSQPPHGLRWTRRHTIAEEHHWRVQHGRAAGWYGEEVRGPDGLDDGEPLDAAQVARIYRALRKGREDGRDEPGAADFYYGEMEMRRLRGRENAPGGWRRTRSVRRIEPFVLSAYWLLAGYGLRASRALVALAALIALLALPLHLGGFKGDRSYGSAILYAVESSISLVRTPAAALTPEGQVLTIALRILGPLLFGLAALALRSRVKR